MIRIYCIVDDKYWLEFHHYMKYPSQDYSIMRHITFETLWKIIRPYGNTPVNYAIGWDNGPAFYKHEIGYSIRPIGEAKVIQEIRIAKLKALIYDKLHESETEYKQKLRKCGQTDCKIDFF
jgi:hypothetical protein